MKPKHHKTRVGITVGDFNGIGPEVILKTLKDSNITDYYTPVIFGSGKLFSYQKNVFKIQINFNYIIKARDAAAGKLNIVNLWRDNVNVNFGEPTEESTRMAKDSLEAGAAALQSGDIDVLVTAPINKDEMMKSGFAYAGHTPFLEEKFAAKGLMMMITPDLKVAVSTHHIPLRKVADSISKEKIVSQIKILNKSLIEDFCIERPKIAILGLNPHAGDGGALGGEEIQIIMPAVKELYGGGILAYGPFPADSFFQPENLKKYDAVLAMYHDQGLIPFKTLAYEDGVNFTAGLPYVRTSPDHGTAYDIAGKNIADNRSFSEAVFAGIKIHKNRTEYEELSTNRLKKANVTATVDEDLTEEAEDPF